MNRFAIYAKRAALGGSLLLSSAVAAAQMAGPPPNISGQRSIPSQTPVQNEETNQEMNMEKSAQDRRFVRQTLEGGIGQIQMGQLAVEKGSSEQVKQFGQKMIDDHTKMNDEMKTFAQHMGMSVPMEPAKNDRKTIAKLSALSGPAFDQAYIKAMVKDHQSDLRDFQEEAAAGQDASLKSAALRQSKVINDHLQVAQQIAMNKKISVIGQ